MINIFHPSVLLSMYPKKNSSISASKSILILRWKICWYFICASCPQSEMEKMRTQISHMEGRLAAALAQTQQDITERITHKLIISEARVREAVSQALNYTASTLSDIRSDVLNISDALAGPLEDLAGDVTGFMAHYNESEAAAREEWRNATASSSSNTCSLDTSVGTTSAYCT